MAARDVTRTGGGGPGGLGRRLSTETKQAFKTTEFWAFVIMVIAILIAGNSIESDGGDDYFDAFRVWLLITILTFGYMLSRGIAKSGSRDPYTESTGGEGGGIGGRMRAAAEAFQGEEGGHGGPGGPTR